MNFREKILKVRQQLILKEDGNSKKTIESLAVFVIILIITIVAINYIWKDENKTEQHEDSENDKILAYKEESIENNDDDISIKLENILKNIKGVGNVKVLITYSQTSKVVPMYSEDSTQKLTEENDSGGGTRTINENTTKKEVIYEESNGEKKPITQSIINPTIEGAIIAAEGANSSVIKENIIQAVEAVTGISSHKIQVFEMKD